MTGLVLRPMGVEDEGPARAAHAALVDDRFSFLLDLRPDEPWSAYVERLERWSGGEDLPADRVRAAFLLAWVDGAVVGRSSIRFALTPWLAAYGGHIGYGVVPGHRRRGHATEILRQSLAIARAEGIDEVVVTCDEGNVGSAAVIERCGGMLDAVVDDPVEGVAKRRYLIR